MHNLKEKLNSIEELNVKEAILILTFILNKKVPYEFKSKLFELCKSTLLKLDREEFISLNDNLRTMLFELLPKCSAEFKTILPLVTEDFKAQQTPGVVFVR